MVVCKLFGLVTDGSFQDSLVRALQASLIFLRSGDSKVELICSIVVAWIAIISDLTVCTILGCFAARTISFCKGCIACRVEFAIASCSIRWALKEKANDRHD